MDNLNKNLISTNIDDKQPITYDNTNENRFVINASKARLVYRDHFKVSKYGTLFFTYLGLFVTCLIAVLTADFKPLFGIQQISNIIFSLFIIATFIFGIATLICLCKYYKTKKSNTEDSFIEDLKNPKYKD